MKIIESFQDDLVFERAYIGEQNGILTPYAVLSGVLCCIRTDPAPLADGVVACTALDRDENCWPIWTVIEKDTATAKYNETIWGYTANERIVAAARKFEALLAAGSAMPGTEL